jgi:hypothetical protein
LNGEFWVSSGHLLLDRSPDGRLLLTDAFLRAFLARPELMPPAEACDAERALHAILLASPRAAADPTELADPDAVENWTAFLAFRQALLDADSIEAAYLNLVNAPASSVPPLFMTQLVHVIMRNALHECPDPFTLRAAELFFRPQRATAHSETMLLADAEAIEGHEAARRGSPLLAMLAPPAVAELAVLTSDNAAGYRARSDAFDMVLNLGGQPSGREALGRAIVIWLRHMLGLHARIESLAALDEPDWRWFIGLDSDATRIGNTLWAGDDAPDANRLLALYRLHLEPDPRLEPQMQGAPITLMLAANSDQLVRFKPQNVLTNLPFRPS